jgi:hypothetical protein
LTAKITSLPDQECKFICQLEINHEIFLQIQAVKESDRNQGGYPGAGEKTKELLGEIIK